MVSETGVIVRQIWSIDFRSIAFGIQIFRKSKSDSLKFKFLHIKLRFIQIEFKPTDQDFGFRKLSSDSCWLVMFNSQIEG